jgi:hypothetical protein
LVLLTPPRADPEIDDGVIEEARRRQRRRRTVIASLLGASALIAGLLIAFLGGGSGRPAGRGYGLGPLPEPKVVMARGRLFVGGQLLPLVVRPVLTPGQVGLEIDVFQGFNGSPVAYPGPSTPLWGSDNLVPLDRHVHQGGEIDFALAEPAVASVRVTGGRILKPFSVPGLPPGVRVVAFYRPNGSVGMFVPPNAGTDTPRSAFLRKFLRTTHTPAIRMTPLNALGRPIPTPPSSVASRLLSLPSTYWQGSSTSNPGMRCSRRSGPAAGPATRRLSRLPRGVRRRVVGRAVCTNRWSGATREPADGRCAVHTDAPGVSVQWAEAVTRIAADRAVVGPAFLSCFWAWYNLPSGGALDAAVLLNAQHPGARPAPLWGAIPIPGHPGFVEVPAVLGPDTPRAAIAAKLTQRYGRAAAKRYLARVPERPALAPLIVARREKNAWLLVENGGTPAKDLAFLNTLTIPRLNPS